jgi:hypothetical protein
VILMIGSSNPSMMALPPVSRVLASPRTSTARGLPWRQHVIDHKGRYACPLDVAELLALGEVVPADVDRVGVGVVPEGDGNYMGYAVLPDRGQPPEPLAPEVVELGMAERAHGVLLLAGHSHGHSTTHNQQDGKRPDRLLSQPEQRE